jgi:hypothetical protein
MAGLMRSNAAGPRKAGNPVGMTPVERFRRSVLSSRTPTNI